MYQSAFIDPARTHPCFYASARKQYGRIHLPVAPLCNIQCAYCRRDYDCANDNRPGVTRKVMTPLQALDHFEQTVKQMPFISVVGIAGPGDAFCNTENTLKTFELIREKYPDIHFCVSSNGLNMQDAIPDLKSLKIGFATITVNAVDPEIGASLVQHVNFKKCRYEGNQASALLIQRQIECIKKLKSSGITVKVNTVVVPGINDFHIEAIARHMKQLGVDLMNLIPMIPLSGTPLAHLTEPDAETIRRLRKIAGSYISQMYHCKRCRSDAAGCLAD